MGINMMCQKLFALALFSMMQAVLMMQAERKVSPTICKHFPDADICNNAEDRSLWHKIKHGVEKVGHDIAKGAEKVGKGIEKGAEKLEKELRKVGEDIGKGAEKVGKDIGEVA